MALTWTLRARIAAPPDRVFAWMSDYREDDHSNPRFVAGSGAKASAKPAQRKIVSRQAGSVVLEDEWDGKRFRSTVRLDPAARTVTIEGEFGYRAVWRAIPDGAHTTLEVRGEMAPSGPMKLLVPLFAASQRKQSEADFRGHVADLEASLRANPAQVP
jgi:hypothetical protein